MSLLSENVIPGDLGKIFSTNAREQSDLERIKNRILSLKGIKDVKINHDVFPIELTIYTSALVKINDIEDKVQITGFHAIPKKLI
ncbi:MAG: hypothetical protein COA49_04045 [Bacteroidetes bacterium]|nr:MAG: hypothetical protein COA49_04045 [Bacteroidota bacterium]